MTGEERAGAPTRTTPLAADAPVVLRAENVVRRLEGEVPVTLVDGVTLDIRRGEFVAIMGPSGSGKSSLLYLLGLLDVPSEGRVWLDGEDTSRYGEDELANRRLEKLGFVFQFHFLLAEFTVLDNVRLPMRRLGRRAPDEAEARARELLGHFQRQYADTVSPFSLSREADALLAAYSFPGNVRELRNIVIRLGTKHPGAEVSAAAMALELEPQLGAPATGIDTADAVAVRGRLLTEGFRLDDELATLERQYVTLALEIAHGNLSRAARLLGVNRTTLYSKLARLGLNPPQE